jgi:hypothetical protein
MHWSVRTCNTPASILAHTRVIRLLSTLYLSVPLFMYLTLLVYEGYNISAISSLNSPTFSSTNGALFRRLPNQVFVLLVYSTLYSTQCSGILDRERVLPPPLFPPADERSHHRSPSSTLILSPNPRPIVSLHAGLSWSSWPTSSKWALTTVSRL